MTTNVKYFVLFLTLMAGCQMIHGNYGNKFLFGTTLRGNLNRLHNALNNLKNEELKMEKEKFCIEQEITKITGWLKNYMDNTELIYKNAIDLLNRAKTTNIDVNACNHFILAVNINETTKCHNETVNQCLDGFLNQIESILKYSSSLIGSTEQKGKELLDYGNKCVNNPKSCNGEVKVKIETGVNQVQTILKEVKLSNLHLRSLEYNKKLCFTYEIRKSITGYINEMKKVQQCIQKQIKYSRTTIGIPSTTPTAPTNVTTATPPITESLLTTTKQPLETTATTTENPPTSGNVTTTVETTATNNAKTTIADVTTTTSKPATNTENPPISGNVTATVETTATNNAKTTVADVTATTSKPATNTKNPPISSNVTATVETTVTNDASTTKVDVTTTTENPPISGNVTATVKTTVINNATTTTTKPATNTETPPISGNVTATVETTATNNANTAKVNVTTTTSKPATNTENPPISSNVTSTVETTASNNGATTKLATNNSTTKPGTPITSAGIPTTKSLPTEEHTNSEATIINGSIAPKTEETENN